MNDLKFNVSDNKLQAFRSEEKIRDISAKLEDHLRNYLNKCDKNKKKFSCCIFDFWLPEETIELKDIIG